MRISSLDKTGALWNSPQLQQIGITVTHRPAPPPEEPLHDPTISTVQVRSFSRAEPEHLLNEQDVPLASAEGRLHLDKLLGALHQVSEQFNLENALQLHAETESWVNTIKGTMNLEQEATHTLQLQGNFGSIELDLEQLHPDHLQQVFSQALAMLSDAALQAQLAELGGHQTISEGFQAMSLLDQKVLELIEVANQLEDKLVLAPSPDSPDILILLRAFQEILIQLGIDVEAIQKQQSTLKMQTQKITDTFAEQLNVRLRRLQEYAQTARSAEWETVKLLK